MDNSEFEKIISNISNDINKSLKSNLGSYFNTVNNNNKVIDLLKSILFTMPEYINLKNEFDTLQNKYIELKNEYDTLKSSNIKNIKMDITETKTKPNNSATIKNNELSENKIIYEKSSDIEQEVTEEDSEEETEEEEEEEEEKTRKKKNRRRKASEPTN